MFGLTATPLKLGGFSKGETESVLENIEIKKKVDALIREGRDAAKGEKCYYCGKEVSSFCNSHSIPAFCLRNIATNGEVLTLNSLVENPVMESKKGVKKAGTFQIICRECDSNIFSEYENPENYSRPPTSKMIAQIALKNSLKHISKRLFETEFFKAAEEKYGHGRNIFQAKIEMNNLDLAEYIQNFQKARKAIERDDSCAYYVCYYERLNYVVPIAFQCPISLVYDFNGNVINDIYNSSPDYKIKNLNLCVFPLEKETIIIMFIEDGDKRLRKFYKQFNSLTLEDKLAALTFIMFAYSEEIYFSKSIEKEVKSSQSLCEVGRSSQEILSPTPFFDALETVRDNYDLNKRHTIPNLLSEKYKLR